MQNAGLLIFLITYVGVALGEIPGLALDRTGFALLGAIAMVVAGTLTPHDAIASVDAPTMLLLYSLMIVSAQLRLGGFYTWIALKVTRLANRPMFFLFVLMLTSATLSALLVNDIICLAFTPIIAVSMLKGGLNPVPFLLGLAISSNIGSAATIIGNPQNMLIGQVGQLDFGRFLLWCAPPSLVSLLAAYGVIFFLYRGRLQLTATPADRISSWPEFNAHQSAKGIIVVILLVGLFFTRFPRELSAIVLAGLLLCSRKMSTRTMLDLVDWHLLTLFVGLFVVIQGIEATNLPQRILQTLGGHGVNLLDLPILTGVSALLSNLVSNVPATMLLVRFLDHSNHVQWYVLALATTYAGNLITIGSIANLIVIEQAQEYGVKITFREHARTGIPVTILSLLIILGWISLLKLTE